MNNELNLKFADNDVEFKLDINKNNIIFGSNGIGKSRLLNAIYQQSVGRLDFSDYNIKSTNIKELDFNQQADFFRPLIQRYTSPEMILRHECRNNLNKLEDKVKQLNNAMLLLDLTVQVDVTDDIEFIKNKQTLAYHQLSHGEQHIFNLLVTVMFSEDMLLLIDDIEFSMSMEAQFKILDVLYLINETNTFIITSHSPLIYRTAEGAESNFSLITYK